MPYCAQCGNNISDQATSCPQCGTPTAMPPSLAGSYDARRGPLDVGQIIQSAMDIYRRNFRTLLPTVAVVVVPAQIITAFAQAAAFRDLATDGPFGDLAPGATPVFDAAAFRSFALGLLVTIVLAGLSSQLATAASLKAVTDAYLGRTSEWRESLAFAWSRLGSVVWVSVLVALGTFLGFLLCVVPGIWLAVSWSLSVPVLLFEGLRGRNALERSYQLVKGRWWPVFGATIVGYLIAGAVGFVLNVPLTFVDVATDGGAVAPIYQAISSSLTQTLTTPFVAAMVAIIYVDQRVRKEGLDPAQLLDD